MLKIIYWVYDGLIVALYTGLQGKGKTSFSKVLCIISAVLKVFSLSPKRIIEPVF
jgi:hypothetical protein